MKLLLALIVTILTLTAAYADDKPKPEQCVEEKIQIQQIRQEVFRLQQQVMQAQFPQVQAAEKQAKEEEERLKALLPKVGPEPKGDKK